MLKVLSDSGQRFTFKGIPNLARMETCNNPLYKSAEPGVMRWIDKAGQGAGQVTPTWKSLVDTPGLLLLSTYRTSSPCPARLFGLQVFSPLHLIIVRRVGIVMSGSSLRSGSGGSRIGYGCGLMTRGPTATRIPFAVLPSFHSSLQRLAGPVVIGGGGEDGFGLVRDLVLTASSVSARRPPRLRLAQAGLLLVGR